MHVTPKTLKVEYQIKVLVAESGKLLRRRNPIAKSIDRRTKLYYWIVGFQLVPIHPTVVAVRPTCVTRL